MQKKENRYTKDRKRMPLKRHTRKWQQPLYLRSEVEGMGTEFAYFFVHFENFFK